MRLKALVWFWLIDETLSANLVYQVIMRAKRYSSELLVACVILILCWLCGTLLRVWRVMPISV